MKLSLLVKYWRFTFVVTGLLCLPVFLLVRASNLLVLEGKEHGVSLRDEGNDRTVRTETLVAYRGLISDRNGELLAVSTPVKSIYADPKFIRSEEIQIIRL